MSAVIGAVAVVALLASRGRAHDAASKKVALEVVDTVTQAWTSEPLTRNASTEFRSKVSEAALRGIFDLYRKLGARRKLGEPVGGSKMTAGIGAMASGVTAEYVFPAEFDAGSATIRIRLVRQADAWKVLGFWVESDALFTQKGA